MAKRQFEVELKKYVTIELDDAVIDAVNYAWRDMFYDLRTPKEIAQHIAFNLVINSSNLSELDGWADQPNSNAKIVDESQWEFDAEEE